MADQGPRPFHKVEIEAKPETRGFQAKPIRSDGIEDRWHHFDDLSDLMCTVAGWLEEGLQYAVLDMERLAAHGAKQVHTAKSAQAWIATQLEQRVPTTP